MPKPLKIAMLIDGWTPVYGGGQKHVYELCRRLCEDHGCRVDLFTRKLISDSGEKYQHYDRLFDRKMRVYRSGPTTRFFNPLGRVLNLFVMTISLARRHKKEGYDVIHAHAYLAGLPAWIVGKLFRIPVVYTIHGTLLMDQGKKNVGYFVEKFFTSGLPYDARISVSHSAEKYLKNTEKLHVIPNGVGMRNFDSIPDVPKSSGISLLWVGRMSPQKGLEPFLKSFAELSPSYLKEKHASLTLVGDGELSENIRELVQDLGLEEFIHFGGSLFGDDLITEYKKHHLFILPSLSEGNPLVLLEAFAAKLPVAATQVGDNAVFINKDNGFLLGEDVVTDLKNIFETPTHTLARMGEKGYTLVSGKYSWSHMTQKTVEVYDQILS